MNSENPMNDTADNATVTEQSLQHLDRLQRRLGDDADIPALAPLPAKAPPSFLRFLPKLIQEFARQGAEVAMAPEGFLTVQGFYRNGPMRIDIEDGSDQIVAVDRRGRRTVLVTFDDLVELNYQHWSASNTRRSYTTPERPWLDHFLQKGWVRRQAIYLPNREGEQTEAEES